MKKWIGLMVLAIALLVPTLAHAVLNSYTFDVYDEDGAALTSGIVVQVQAASGSTAETIYSDPNGKVSLANPITVTGQVKFFYGANTCDVVVYDNPLTTKIKKAGITPRDHRIVFPKTQFTSQQLATVTFSATTATIGTLGVTSGSTLFNTSFSDSSITNVGDIKVDSISADDGSSFSMGNNWTNAGRTVADAGILTTVDINGGTIDGTAIGANSMAAGNFNDLNVTQAVSTDVTAIAAYDKLTLSGTWGTTAPSYGLTSYSKLLGANIAATDAYMAAVTGMYGITGTNATTYPACGVLGWIGDLTTTADAAFIALLDGDSGATSAGAAYGVRYLTSTPGNAFNYGLDLYSAAIGAYSPVTYATADIRLQNGETITNSPDGTITTTGILSSPNIQVTDTLTADSPLVIKSVTSKPSAPTAGYVKLYWNSVDAKAYIQDEAGTETPLN
jgi:hypothetical protein